MRKSRNKYAGMDPFRHHPLSGEQYGVDLAPTGVIDITVYSLQSACERCGKTFYQTTPEPKIVGERGELDMGKFTPTAVCFDCLEVVR